MQINNFIDNKKMLTNYNLIVLNKNLYYWLLLILSILKYLVRSNKEEALNISKREKELKRGSFSKVE